jgi:hypothetical protein
MHPKVVSYQRHFVTFDVTDLYTMIPRQGALEALMRFLVQHLHGGRIGTLSINDIMRMARLVLDTNYFAYKDKYYLQIRGGAMGSAFTCWNGNSPWSNDNRHLMNSMAGQYSVFI